MKWTKGELQKLNIKTQKVLTMKGIHHPNVTSTNCTYIRARVGEGSLESKTLTTVSVLLLQ
eukprot:1584484-Ditylum_brightwellii.AAC.1